MTGVCVNRVGSRENRTAETNGITVNFIELPDFLTSGRTSVNKDDFFDEIIFSKI